MQQIRYPESYYAATAADQPPRPPLMGDADCDVCVIGAGYTGLSAALHLAERGYDVIVIDREAVGWGASGRNGGQICTGFSADMAALEKRLGFDAAKRLWDLSEDAKTLLRDTIAANQIACDLSEGYFVAALNQRHMAELAELQNYWSGKLGYQQTRMIGPDQIRDYVNSPIYRGGLFDAGGGSLHPLNYAIGLAKAAERAGARIFAGTEAGSIEDGAKASVVTAHGRIRAHQVVLCGNAYLAPLGADLSRKIMPVVTSVGATESLPPDLAQSLVRRGMAVCDARHIVDYFRVTPDGRLLWGGGATYWIGGSRSPAQGLTQRMRKVFPQLRDVSLSFAWSGKVAITFDRMPYFGRKGGNIWFAMGFSGHGVALTGLAGKLIAQAIAGATEDFDRFASLEHRAFPGGALRAPVLAAGMAMYRLRDML